jgi:hypothetical protein
LESSPRLGRLFWLPDVEDNFWLTAEQPTLSTYFVGCFAASESVAKTVTDECLGQLTIGK